MFLILRPDSEYACSLDGYRKVIGLYGIVNVNGKCQSSCHLQYATIEINPPVTNNGAGDMISEQAGSPKK